MNADRIQDLLEHLGEFANHLRPRSHAANESMIHLMAGLAIGAAGMYLYSSLKGNKLIPHRESRAESAPGSGSAMSDGLAGI